jgi:hypothetical protein
VLPVELLFFCGSSLEEFPTAEQASTGKVHLSNLSRLGRSLSLERELPLNLKATAIGVIGSRDGMGWLATNWAT